LVTPVHTISYRSRGRLYRVPEWMLSLVTGRRRMIDITLTDPQQLVENNNNNDSRIRVRTERQKEITYNIYMYEVHFRNRFRPHRLTSVKLAHHLQTELKLVDYTAANVYVLDDCEFTVFFFFFFFFIFFFFFFFCFFIGYDLHF